MHIKKIFVLPSVPLETSRSLVQRDESGESKNSRAVFARKGTKEKGSYVRRKQRVKTLKITGEKYVDEFHLSVQWKKFYQRGRANQKKRKKKERKVKNRNCEKRKGFDAKDIKTIFRGTRYEGLTNVSDNGGRYSKRLYEEQVSRFIPFDSR